MLQLVDCSALVFTLKRFGLVSCADCFVKDAYKGKYKFINSLIVDDII